jgi:hypothetical protein
MYCSAKGCLNHVTGFPNAKPGEFQFIAYLTHGIVRIGSLFRQAHDVFSSPGLSGPRAATKPRENGFKKTRQRHRDPCPVRRRPTKA